jgi:membrane protein implicated in regulation of membrane protease activity
MPYEKQSVNRRYLQEQKSWVVTRWRPITAWVYLIICIFDFIIGPVFYAWFAATTGIVEFGSWQPLTVAGGGIFHISMGAILGVSAFTRGQEKITAMQVYKNTEIVDEDIDQPTHNPVNYEYDDPPRY